MNDLENLNLTISDFQMIVEGLESLPNKDLASSMMRDLLTDMLTKGDENEEVVTRIKRDHELQQIEEKKEKELMIENIRILQGKIIQLRRYMEVNNLLTEANKIISN